MFVEFWDVGAGPRESAQLAMTVEDVCEQLTLDWIPSLAPADGATFMGWPQFLLEEVSYGGSMVLALRELTGRCERQWKGILSWMLGVAGARRFLQEEGYTWIAPLSAFYSDAAQLVSYMDRPPNFPAGRLVVERDPDNKSRLRPDYIAAKLNPTLPSGWEWAIAEAKGTISPLSLLHS